MPLVRQALLTGVSVLIISGCSNPQAQDTPSLPDNSATSRSASANPPSVLMSQPNIPSASAFYPTGHPSLQPSTSVSKPSTASARGSASGRPASGLASSDALPSLEPAVPSGSIPLAGSSSPSNAPSKNDAGSTFDNLELVDASLKSTLAVMRVGSEPGANSLLSVFAGLKNKTSHPLQLEVQTVYQDNLGKPLNGGSWIPITLKPHEETEYRSSAISIEADDFTIRIRKARDDGPASTGGN